MHAEHPRQHSLGTKIEKFIPPSIYCKRLNSYISRADPDCIDNFSIMFRIMRYSSVFDGNHGDMSDGIVLKIQLDNDQIAFVLFYCFSVSELLLSWSWKMTCLTNFFIR